MDTGYYDTPFNLLLVMPQQNYETNEGALNLKNAIFIVVSNICKLVSVYCITFYTVVIFVLLIFVKFY